MGSNLKNYTAPTGGKASPIVLCALLSILYSTTI